MTRSVVASNLNGALSATAQVCWVTRVVAGERFLACSVGRMCQLEWKPARQPARDDVSSEAWVKRCTRAGRWALASCCFRSHNQSFVRTPRDAAALASRGAGAAQLHRWAARKHKVLESKT